VVWWGKKAQARDQRQSGATIAIQFSRDTEYFHLAPATPPMEVEAEQLNLFCFWWWWVHVRFASSNL
jgi:hypothetical protein